MFQTLIVLGYFDLKFPLLRKITFNKQLVRQPSSLHCISDHFSTYPNFTETVKSDSKVMKHDTLLKRRAGI